VPRVYDVRAGTLVHIRADENFNWRRHYNFSTYAT